MSLTASESIHPAPEPEATDRPTREQLLADFGAGDYSIQALFRFCFVPSGRLALLRELAPEEEWGDNHFALLRYLATHLRRAVEQGAYVWNGDQLVLCAGRLTSRSGTPLYVGVVHNTTPQDNRWVLNWVGERPSCPEVPEPPLLGTWPNLEPGAEVLLGFDPADADRRPPLGPLESLPPLLQSHCLVGAMHWSLHRGLAVRQLHGGGRGYFVPLYLTQRADLSLPPDFVAPVFTQGRRVVVRTLLEPQAAYAPARVAVDRWETLPNWLVEAWEDAVAAREGNSETAS
jgi:hypothetical protein